MSDYRDPIQHLLAGYHAAGVLLVGSAEIGQIYGVKDPRTRRNLMSEIGCHRVHGRLKCSLNDIEQHLRCSRFPGPREKVRGMLASF